MGDGGALRKTGRFHQLCPKEPDQLQREADLVVSEMHAELLVRFPRAVEDVPSGALRHGGAAMSEGHFRASAHGSLPGRTTLDHANLTPDQLFLRAVPAFFVNASGGPSNKTMFTKALNFGFLICC